ncbi:myo-inositol 2-dehydrogenase [Lachnospiraceae bacterium]|nr:myo-inositol 2-dehydrogenase [Lachnospiraceae bacterium]
MEGQICIGMAGAGRATELHMNALMRFSEFPVRYKRIAARRQGQVNDMKERYGFETASLDFDDLLKDDEIDVIDICTPPYVHEEMIEKALKAGKHVICEKPLTGYFGLPGDTAPIGINVSKVRMYEGIMKSLERLKEIIDSSDRKFMYAENFIYAPAIVKAAEIIQAKKSRILFAKGEESLKGSSSPVAGEWNKTGGGTFIRTGAHPLSAILWLKQQEASVQNKEIRVKSVLADMGCVTPSLTEYEHRHISARPKDVEDSGTVILTFSDGSKAVVMANDTLLGGSRNYVELYCNDAAIHCTLTMADMMETYFLDEDGLGKVDISEMLPSKTGWNKPFLLDEIMRGYTDEMKDFMQCVMYDREPKSDFGMAYETARIIYAAYMSAETGHVVEI